MPSPCPWPRLSVVIPAYNEAYYIADCLQAIQQQDYPGTYEVIVVDNKSSDATTHIAAQYGATVVHEERIGIGYALTAGVAHATGTILCFTDADTRVPRSWLSQIVTLFTKNPSASAVGGSYIFYDASRVTNIIVRTILTPLYHRFIFPYFPVASGVNMAVRRSAYDQSSGIVPTQQWGQDITLCKKLHSQGEIVFDPQLLVFTSFRRYSGEYTNLFLRFFRCAFEVVRQTVRFIGVTFAQITYAPLKPIRAAPRTWWVTALVNGCGILVLLVVWIIYIAYTPSTQAFGHVIFHGPATSQMVALTFDDGPYGESTLKILDILRNKDVKATFFVVGNNAEKYPDIIKREIAEGHVIGNHSLDHSLLLPLETAPQLERNVTITDIIIAHVVNRHPRFYRPPFGLKSPTMIRTLHHLGYSIITWDDTTEDYSQWESADTITRSVLRQLHAGAIIDLHDGRDTHLNYPRNNIVKALPDIIDGIRKAGYVLVTIDTLIDEKAYF